MAAAFISIMLLIVARHHPPSRRKIKEIWHGRVYWESNTTMLRSSPEKVLENVEPTELSKPSTVIPSESTNEYLADITSRLERPTPNVIAPINTKPMIAICAATHSKSNWRSLGDTALRNILIPSIQKTISSSDRSKYDFRLYLAADHDDHFWLKNQNNIKTPDWLSVHVGFYEVSKHKIPFNPMMRAAYNDGAGYLVRINDDSEFLTSDWVSKAVAKLASYDPLNVGMVGPNCREGNTAIMTHDMVHRTHLDIFEHYYPEAFSAWWIDDWISKVYGPRRSTKMMDWTVKHHTHKHGTRYEVQHREAKLLKGELEKGAVKIEAWLSKTDKSEPNMRLTKQSTPTKLKTTETNNKNAAVEVDNWTVVVTVSIGFDDMFSNWFAFYSKLNLDMNVILIAEDEQIYKKYINVDGIDVWKSQYPDSNDPIALSYETPQYKKLVSRRAAHLLRVLKVQKRIIYTDIDTVWLSDPRPFFKGDFDLFAQLDGNKYYCTGFIALQRTKNTLSLLEEWNRRLLTNPQLNQPIFNKIIKSITIKHKELPRQEFPSGDLYFGQNKQQNVVIVHNNYIVGKDNKIQRFKEVGLWSINTPQKKREKYSVEPLDFNFQQPMTVPLHELEKKLASIQPIDGKNVFHLGISPWSPARLRTKFNDFEQHYAFKNNNGGMRLPHQYAIFSILNELKPTTIVESGVWKGVTTQLIRKVLPHADIISIDPVCGFKKLTQHTTFCGKNFQDLKDLGLVWKDLDMSSTLLILDDHQSGFDRLKLARHFGFIHVITEDNHPFGTDDNYSLKQLWMEPENDLVIVKNNFGKERKTISKAKHLENRKNVLEWLETYVEFPPLNRKKTIDWFREYDFPDNPYKSKPRSDVDAMMPAGLGIPCFVADKLIYHFIAYCKLKVTNTNGIDRKRVTKPPEGTQMGPEQIQEILSVLPKNGNLLVWGLGNDSPFWHDSTDGKVVFIEDDIPEKKAGTLWFDMITAKYPFLEAYAVHYTTDTVKSYDKYMRRTELWDIDLDIRAQLPNSVTNTRWDVILVDAPLGCCNVGPGRYQSIYTSKLLSNSDTHVFVDDYERKVEKQFSLKVFDQQPVKIVKRQTAASNANDQAHFVHVSINIK
jgi:uncharacterized protein (TIGR01627 family)